MHAHTPPQVTRHQLAQVRAKDEHLSAEQREKAEQQRRREMGEEEYARMIEIENCNRDDSLVEASGVEAALSVLKVGDECALLTGACCAECSCAENAVQRRPADPTALQGAADEILGVPPTRVARGEGSEAGPEGAAVQGHDLEEVAALA